MPPAGLVLLRLCEAGCVVLCRTVSFKGYGPLSVYLFAHFLPLIRHAANFRPLSDCQNNIAPKILFGTATFGMGKTDFQDAKDFSVILQASLKAGVHRLDMGARYPPMKPGESEELIGETSEISNKFLVETNIYTNTQTDGAESWQATLSRSPFPRA